MSERCETADRTKQVLQTLLYFEIFTHPLLAEEVQQYCSGEACQLDEVRQQLDELVSEGEVFRFGDYYQTHNDPSWVARRLEFNQRADVFLPLAQKMARFIGAFPFIRAVLVSGSLSKHSMSADSDIDFFMITRPGRLWLARTLLVLFKKIVLFNSHKYFCVNYFVDTEHLEIEEKNIFTATGGSEVEAVWSIEDNLPVASAQLSAGSFIFKVYDQNGNPVSTFGDDSADALLDADGAEIQITEAGGYKVLLDINRPDYTYQLRLTSFDRRGLFYTDGQNLDINDLTLFTEGYAVRKFKNVRSDGTPGKDTDFPDTDFPMFRLADVYLMAAEAILRGAGGGDKNQAALYFNKVRERAFTGTSGNFTPANLSLDVILDERARELYWECHRRTDLVRFGKFTDGNYLWAWKGGTKEGQTVPNFRNIYPIPSADRGANPNLQQNQGY